MTPNLASARQAIQAELSHARQGMEFYSARVEALETALTQLESVEIDEEAPDKGGRKKTAASSKKSDGSARGRKPRLAKDADASRPAAAKGVSAAKREGKRGRKVRGANRSSGEGQLPTTGTDFWLQLVTEEPRSAVDIANAAADSIGLKPDQRELIQKLKQRVAPALATLVSAQKIQDTGAGRERRFFKGEQQAA
jgi:hypothetical protein